VSARLRADLTLFLVAVIWGSAFAAQRVVAVTGAVFIFNGLRFLLGALVIYPFAAARLRTSDISNRRERGIFWGNLRVPSELRGKKKESANTGIENSRPLAGSQWWMVLLAGGLLFIGAALQQAGMRTTTAANAGFFTGLYVVFVPFLLWIGWRERPAWLLVISVILAAGGAYLLSTGGKTFRLHPGDELELLGAVFWAFHVVVVGKFAPRLDALAFSAGQFAVCGLLNLAAGAATEPFNGTILLSFLGPLVYTGVLSVGIGYTLQVWAQRYTPATYAALILSAETVMAALFGYLLLGETLTAIQLAGCGLILAGIVLAQVKVV